MADSPFALDPEVEALLREVAQDPHSTLLRVERPKAIRGLLEREPVVGVATAGLTLAERHLVQTKRAEVAYSLRVLSANILAADPRTSGTLSLHGVTGVFDQNEHSSGMRATLSSVLIDLERMNPVDARPLKLHRDMETWPSVLRLSAVAQRLDPTDNARIHAANWLSLEGQYRSEIAILSSILHYPTTRHIRSRAQSNIGFALHRIGQQQRSLAFYRGAHRSDPAHFAAAGSRLIVAAQIGSQKDLVDAAARLDEQWTADSLEVQWLRQAQLARRSDPLTHLSHQGRELLARTRDLLGSTSRSLTDVLV